MLSLSEPALGAMLAAGGLPGLRVILLGTVAAAAGYLCIYSLNDLLDLSVDREEVRRGGADGWRPAVRHLDITTLRHPVAAGALSFRVAALWVAVLGLVGLVAAYALRPLCAVLFVGCALLEVLYCGLKRRTWLKTVPAGVMVGLGGLAGWFAAAAGGPTWGAAAFFLLLVAWEIFGRNLSNDLADLAHDRALGITTVATVWGPSAAAGAIAVGACLMPPLGLVQAGSWAFRVTLALVAVGTMTLPAIRLRRAPEETAAQSYFNRASLFPALGATGVLVLSVLAL